MWLAVLMWVISIINANEKNVRFYPLSNCIKEPLINKYIDYRLHFWHPIKSLERIVEPSRCPPSQSYFSMYPYSDELSTSEFNTLSHNHSNVVITATGEVYPRDVDFRVSRALVCCKQTPPGLVWIIQTHWVLNKSMYKFCSGKIANYVAF